MSKIKIMEAKAIRENLGMDCVVILAIDAQGTQHVATHGKTRLKAKQAAELGNQLKTLLKWPAEMCQDTPLRRECKNCAFYKPDYGIHCFNGWSGDGSSGHCRLEPTHTKVSADNTCQHFEPNC